MKIPEGLAFYSRIYYGLRDLEGRKIFLLKCAEEGNTNFAFGAGVGQTSFSLKQHYYYRDTAGGPIGGPFATNSILGGPFLHTER